MNSVAMPRKLRFSRKYFAMPYAVLSVIFVVIPLMILLYYALTNEQGGFTLGNFVKFFTKIDIIKRMLFSLLIALITTVVCFLLAYPVALILSNSKINKSAILVMMFILPMWINSLLRTYAIKNLLDLINFDNAYVAVTIGMVYDFFPFMLLPLYTILNNMDKSYIEASTDLGASPVKTFFKVILPLSVPGIVSGALMVFMPTVSTFAISKILGSTDTYMFGNIIEDAFKNSDKNGWHTGSAYAFILLILIGITMLIANKLTKGKSQPTGGGLL